MITNEIFSSVKVGIFMSIEEIKSALLALVDEANKLDEKELATVPYSTVKVKSGQARNFDRLAGWYYETINNIRLDDSSNIDYSKIVFDKLNEELAKTRASYYTTKADELLNVTNKDSSRFLELTKTLNTLKVNGETLKKRTESLNLDEICNLKGLDANLQANLEKVLTGISEELTSINDNINAVKNDMSRTAVDINKAFAKALLDHKKHLEEKFLAAPKVDQPSFANNGVAILASDLEEYNALLELISIRSKINYQEDLELIDGVFCVNTKDLKHTKDLFTKIEILKVLNKPLGEPVAQVEPVITPSKNEKEELNNVLISLIDNRISEIADLGKNLTKDYKKKPEGKIPNGNFAEYNRLTDLKKILARGITASNYQKVWDIAYISKEGTDLELFKSLFKNEPIFKEYDPNTGKRKENEKVITEILNCVEEYASAASEKAKNSTSNIPWKPTHKIANKVWLVEEKDLIEVNRLIDIAKILQDTENLKEDDELEKVLGIGYVKKDNIPKFEALAKATNYFADKLQIPAPDAIPAPVPMPIPAPAPTPVVEPKINPTILIPPKNEEYIKLYLARLNELKEKAESKTENFIKIGMNSIDILKDDEPEAKLLFKLLGYLQAEKKSLDITRYNDVILDAGDTEEYQKALDALEKLQKKKSANSEELNNSLIENLKLKINALEPNSKLANLYNTQIEILEEAKTSKDDLIPTEDGATISKRLEKRYNRTLDDITKLLTPEPVFNQDINKDAIVRAEETLQTLDAEADKEEITLLTKFIDYLKEGQTSLSTITGGTYTIASDHYKEFIETKEKFNNLHVLKLFNKINQPLKDAYTTKINELNSKAALSDLEKELLAILKDQLYILNDYINNKEWYEYEIDFGDNIGKISYATTIENNLKMSEMIDKTIDLIGKIKEAQKAPQDDSLNPEYVNEPFIQKYQNMIADLEKEAKASNSPDLITISGHTILSKDEDELSTLLELIEYLEYAKKVPANELKQVGAVLINHVDEDYYNINYHNLERISKNKNLNKDLIDAVTKRLNELPATLTAEENELESLLKAQRDFLLDARTSDILVPTSDSAQISVEHKDEYEELLTKIAKLEQEIANLKNQDNNENNQDNTLNNDINNDKIREFTASLDNIIDQAKGASASEISTFADDNTACVLLGDVEEAKILDDIIKLLYNAKKSTNLKDYGNIKLDKNDEDDYLELLDKLNEIALKKKQDANKLPEKNTLKIAGIDQRIGIIIQESLNTPSPERTIDDNIVDSIYKDEYNALIEKIAILKNVSPDAKLVAMDDGTIIREDAQDRYNELDEILEEVAIERQENTGLFQKVSQGLKQGIRKFWIYNSDRERIGSKYNSSEYYEQTFEEKAADEEALTTAADAEPPKDDSEKTKELINELLSNISKILNNNREFVSSVETKEELESNMENLLRQKNQMGSALQKAFDLIEGSNLSWLTKKMLNKKADNLNGEYLNYCAYLSEACKNLEQEPPKDDTKDPFAAAASDDDTVISNSEIDRLEASLVNLSTPDEIEEAKQILQDIISDKEDLKKSGRIKGKALEQLNNEINRLTADFNELNYRLSNMNTTPEPIISNDDKIMELNARRDKAKKTIDEITAARDMKRLDELSDLQEEIKKIDEEIYNLTGGAPKR